MSFLKPADARRDVADTFEIPLDRRAGVIAHQDDEPGVRIDPGEFLDRADHGIGRRANVGREAVMRGSGHGRDDTAPKQQWQAVVSSPGPDSLEPGAL